MEQGEKLQPPWSEGTLYSLPTPTLECTWSQLILHFNHGQCDLSSHSHSSETDVITAVKFYDDCQSTHERTLRGGRALLLPPSNSVCLTFVSLTFHTHLFTRMAYRYGRCALVLVMPARPRFAISGILAGGIPGFGIATFLLGTSRFIP